jgi:beta-glucosidase
MTLKRRTGHHILPRLVPIAGALAGAVLLAPSPSRAESPPAACKDKPCLYLDTARSPEERAADLVARMTLEEKAAQLGDVAPGIPRLGVPRYNWWNEGLHGVARAGVATVFPQAIGMAAAWDAPLMYKVGDVISTEFRAKYLQTVKPDGGSDRYHGLTVWSPNINIFRDPRWGRGQETYGEDPYLTSRLAVGFIKGLQGNDPSFFKTIATSKHFAVHSGPESTRHQENIYPSPHDLEDTYLPAFRATVTEGKVQSVMCAYNAVNGVPACANQDLLEQHLRRDWGFTGYVVSDCGAAANIYRKDSLHYKQTPEEAVTVAFKAGMDLICGDYRNHATTEVEPIINAVRQGMLPQAVIDRALKRLFVARIRLGMFNPAQSTPYASIKPTDNDTPAHEAVALDLARESMVLLKNDGLLPLKAAPKTIAVIGPNADNQDALVGNYNGTPSKPVTVLAGIRARFPDAKLEYVKGAELAATADSAEQAIDAAKRADLVVFVGGLSARLEGEELKLKVPGFFGGDRTSLDLPAPQEQLLERVQGTGKPVVLVLMNGSALSVNWADKHVPAIIEAWYPGGEGGHAVAGLIAGDYSPAGRLPVTFYQSADQLPPFGDYRMDGRTYRYFKGQVLYPFGYGLSYTRFHYQAPALSAASIKAGEATSVTVALTNTGRRDGDEVVQLYVAKPGDSANPSLAGFSRVHLKAGATQSVSLPLDARALSQVDAQGVRKVVPGAYTLYVGGGQPRFASTVKATLTVTGTPATLPK